MSDPWFDPAVVTWVPGTILGIAAGVIGLLLGLLSGKPGAKPWLYAATILLLIACLAVAAVGGLAYAYDQPEVIGSSLVMAGLICALIVGTLLFVLPSIFRSASPPRRR